MKWVEDIVCNGDVWVDGLVDDVVEELDEEYEKVDDEDVISDVVEVDVDDDEMKFKKLVINGKIKRW